MQNILYVIYIYIYIYIYTYMWGLASSRTPRRAAPRGRRAAPRQLWSSDWGAACSEGSSRLTLAPNGRSELQQVGAFMTTGHRLFGKEFLGFDTMPCRHMFLFAHF